MALLGVKHQVDVGSWLSQSLQQDLLSISQSLFPHTTSFSKKEGSLVDLKNCNPDGKCK